MFAPGKKQNAGEFGSEIARPLEWRSVRWREIMDDVTMLDPKQGSLAAQKRKAACCMCSHADDMVFGHWSTQLSRQAGHTPLTCILV